MMQEQVVVVQVLFASKNANNELAKATSALGIWRGEGHSVIGLTRWPWLVFQVHGLIPGESTRMEQVACQPVWAW